jgi:hypothetical protein
MTTIRITTECALPPARVLYAAYDFGPRRFLQHFGDQPPVRSLTGLRRFERRQARDDLPTLVQVLLPQCPLFIENLRQGSYAACEAR